MNLADPLILALLATLDVAILVNLRHHRSRVDRAERMCRSLALAIRREMREVPQSRRARLALRRAS